MSRWTGWEREYDEGYEHEREGPPDVSALLDEGRSQLLHAYCFGDNECTNLAWSYFEEAFRQTKDLRIALLWVAKQYADLGFFADSAELLTELCAKFKDESARRLLAEVRWWRDNAHRIPWVPPPGDGSRYKRMMSFIDPDAPDDEEIIRQLRRDVGLPGLIERADSLEPELADALDVAMSAFAAEPARDECRVDWAFLDTDDGQPGELPEWAIKMMRHFPAEHAAEIARRHRWSRPIKPPAHPPRYSPDEPPFDPQDFLPFDDD
jgi:hypothetical protein